MDHVDGFYCKLLGSSNDQAFSLDHDALELPFVNLAHHYDPITMDEVWDVVKYLLQDRAPGPDVFTGRL